jgi:hypothetical protein
VEFGDKAAGGPGDEASGAWLERELRTLGFQTTRQTFDITYFETGVARLSVPGAEAAVHPQAIVSPTPAGGVDGPLVLWSPHLPAGALKGALALVVLPHRRWSTASSPEVRGPTTAALKAGARGVILVTTGPTGQMLALNGSAERPLFDGPVAVLAPNASAPFVAAAHARAPARLTITGRGGRREAWNLVGRLDRGAGRRLVVSTPRSGWFTCAGERGPGVAIWLALARWAAAAPLRVDLTFLCTSGHEYDNRGGVEYLKNGAPSPAETGLWVHLGANAAARDWHEAGARLLPLPSADPQRYLVTTERPELLRKIFAGEPGLEAVYPSGPGVQGELSHFVEAGYRVFGVFGAHRFHHAPDDDLRCVDGAVVARTGERFRRAVETMLT